MHRAVSISPSDRTHTCSAKPKGSLNASVSGCGKGRVTKPGEVRIAFMRPAFVPLFFVVDVEAPAETPIGERDRM